MITPKLTLGCFRILCSLPKDIQMFFCLVLTQMFLKLFFFFMAQKLPTTIYLEYVTDALLQNEVIRHS